MRKFKPVYYSIFSLLLLFFSGCSSVTDPSVYKPAGPVSDKAVQSVLLLEKVVDQRPADEMEMFYNVIDPLILVPFWPYITSKVSPLAKYTYFESDLPDVMQGLFAKDIQASGIFPKVIQVLSSKDKDISENAFILSLKLKRAVWIRHQTTYGLSSPGAFLYFFLPVSYGRVLLEVEAELADVKTGKTISQKTLSREISCTEWIYYQSQYGPCVAEARLTEIFPQVTGDLREFLLKTVSGN